MFYLHLIFLIADTITLKNNVAVTWKRIKWQKGTCSQSECTEAPRHVPLPIRSSSGALVHLLGDRHSATSDILKKSIREVLLCLFPLAQWDSEVHTCSKGKMLNLVKLKSHEGFNSWSMALPFEGHAICSYEKLLKIPANVIDFDRRPVEFLYVSNNRVDKWQRFLWWNREWHGIWVFQG